MTADMDYRRRTCSWINMLCKQKKLEEESSNNVTVFTVLSIDI